MLFSSWNSIKYIMYYIEIASWIEAKNGVLSKGKFQNSCKRLGPFSILRSVMFLKQSDFFLYFVIWYSRCHESWVLKPSRWARHSEWNIVVKVNFWTHFCSFVGDVIGWIIYSLFIYLLIYLSIIYYIFIISLSHWFTQLANYLFVYFGRGRMGNWTR